MHKVLSKISNLVGKNKNFLAKIRKLSILPTLLDIFWYSTTLCAYSVSPSATQLGVSMTVRRKALEKL